MTPDLVLDCSGMRCPRPIVEMAKAMRRMGPGQVLELLATDPVAKKDVPAWCQKTGNEFLDEEETLGHFKFHVRKRG
jgi:tRNA 2-thiouridine synthesizing protein A|tara:strand:- start:126 stop:356 length:231 start_codon:yes stop_codon:yes gene_type:complete